MTPNEMQALLRNLDVRTSRIEQILPTLATKEDLKAFATKKDLRREINGLRTELKAQIDDVRREARILNEDVRGDIRLLAEHLVSVMQPRNPDR